MRDKNMQFETATTGAVKKLEKKLIELQQIGIKQLETKLSITEDDVWLKPDLRF